MAEKRGHVEIGETGPRKTRVAWSKLDRLNPNPDRGLSYSVVRPIEHDVIECRPFPFRGNPVSVQHSCPKRGGNPVQRFPEEPKHLQDNDLCVHYFGRKSGVGSGEEIRCRFSILARKDEPTPDYARKPEAGPDPGKPLVAGLLTD